MKGKVAHFKGRLWQQCRQHFGQIQLTWTAANTHTHTHYKLAMEKWEVYEEWTCLERKSFSRHLAHQIL